ncbi:MAG TPA: hypothetical protein VD931_04215 [Baekduia sp.]|nr:hypothetical protein [Baekduia sp.]
MKLRPSLLPLLAASATLLAPAGAAASSADVIRDCGDDGKLSKRYSQKEYRDALRDLPTDVDEYTDCRDVIRDARLAAAGGSGDGGSGGGGGGGAAGGGPGGGGGVGDATAGAGGLLTDPLADATQEERDAVARAQAGGGDEVTIGGDVVRPGEVGLGSLSGGGDLPAPLLGALLLLAAGTLAGAAIAGRRLIAARRGPTAA